MNAPTLSLLERRHAIEAPFTDFDDWAKTLTPGICTACGHDAYAGPTGWWHLHHRICPDRHEFQPEFAKDP